MANAFSTVANLQDDALWMGGEVQSSSSQYYDRSLDLINAVQTLLVAGGALGDRTLPQTDWWWAHSRYRGAVTLLNAFNTARGVSLVLTQDSTTATFASMTTGLSMVDYYLLVDGNRDHMVRISEHTTSATTATLALAWKPATVTTTGYVVAPLDYALPADFLRFAGPIAHGRPPYEIGVTDLPRLEQAFARGSVGAGTPTLAAMVDDDTIRFNRYMSDAPLVAEFEYIIEPATLTRGGSDPVMPQPHRRILSLGAAFCLLLEKNDTRSSVLYGMFAAAWEAMQVEQAKGTDNRDYGRIIPRPNQASNDRYPLRTSSGLIIG